MAKFICTRSKTQSVPVGTILIGVQDGSFIRLTQDSDLKTDNGSPRFSEGNLRPMEGNLWTWTLVEG